MATGDIVTLRAVGRYQDQNIVNTFHYEITDQQAGETEILDTLLTAWENTVEPDWLTAHSTAYTLVGLKAFNHTGAAKTPAFRSVGFLGSRSGTPAANFVCRTITMYTASAKHRRRGRFMLSGTITEDIDANDGSLTDAAIAVLDALGAVLDGAIMHDLNTFVPGIPPTAVDPFEPFTDYKGRETPSSVTSRRIRQFSIG